MGITSSKITKRSSKDIVMIRQKALQRYISKIKIYDESIHGTREDYMEQVEADYESECIPENRRSK